MRPFTSRVISGLSYLEWAVGCLLTVMWVGLMLKPNGWGALGFWLFSTVFCLASFVLAVIPTLARYIKERSPSNRRSFLVSVLFCALVALEAIALNLIDIPGGC